MKVYTKRGDDGTTGLLYGGRVSKDDLRTEAYGTTDEAVSALGLARAAVDDGEWSDAILAVQRELFVVGAELATDPASADRLRPGESRVTDEMVDELERRIDALIERFPLPQEFVVPGESPAGAWLDLGRSVVRRAERQVVRLLREGHTDRTAPLRYLNRLSDYLFVLARSVEGGQFTRTRAD
ncbi:MAG: cob(I)yrinic acid a,c-diamide adenosyltransferase [Egibacteraceae bacterium]